MQENIFSQRLQEIMKQRNVKQVDIIRAAEQKGIKLGKSHISQYVAGKTVPRENILRFLADYLMVDVNWLNGNVKIELPINTIDNKPKGDRTMREFKKSAKLNDVLYDVRGPVVDEATRMEEAGTKVLKLNIGNPAPFGFSAPDEVIYDMKSHPA